MHTGRCCPLFILTFPLWPVHHNIPVVWIEATVNHPGGLSDRGEDLYMCSAATQVLSQCFSDFNIGCMRIPVQEGLAVMIMPLMQ